MKWVELGCTYGNLAHSVYNNDKVLIKKYIHELINILFNIADTYNINLNESWLKWKKKALAKRYYSGS